jgi:molybdopterin molybdotransferase
MIPVEEALNKILFFVRELEPENKPILQCLGQVLSEAVFSGIDVPPLDNSAMDGFAVRAEDTYGASNNFLKILPVIDQVAAGYLASKKVVPQTAIRIMTGAVLPEGANAVVQFEDTDEVKRKSTGGEEAFIGISKQAIKGQNIRLKGEDIAKGKMILQKGTILRAAHIGVLASLGYLNVSVIRRPIVAVLVTGDELVDVGQPLVPGKIYNSNAYSLAAQIINYGGIPKILGIGRDSVESINRKIDNADGCDMLITSGGVSLGDYDVVKEVLAKRGKIELWTVCMKPGKPAAFGTITIGDKKILHLGLPGNPVSSMVTFEQFVRPAMLKMMGKEDIEKQSVQAIMDDDVINSDGRRVYVRVILYKKDGTYHARLTGPQGSGVLTSMVKANGLAIVPENTIGVKVGDSVKVQILD